jgi:hypothetical protein
MPNYQNGKIYTLRSYQTDDIYIGSTTQSLAKRKGGHKCNYTQFQKGKGHYVTSFEVVKYDDCYIELLEEYPCENRQQLEKREGELIRTTDCVNKAIAGRNSKQYYQDNREQLLEKATSYAKTHKTQISKKHKQYYQDNREQLLEKATSYAKTHKTEKSAYDKEYHKTHQQQKIACSKQHYETNKAEILKKNKAYRERNETAIKLREAQKTTCECGIEIQKKKMLRHCRSQRHQTFINLCWWD